MLLKLGRVLFAFSFGSLEGKPRVLGITCNRVLGIACIQEFPLARNIVLFLRMNFVVMLLLFLLGFFSGIHERFYLYIRITFTKIRTSIGNTLVFKPLLFSKEK